MQLIRTTFLLALFGLMLFAQACTTSSGDATGLAAPDASGTATAQFVKQTIEPAFEGLDVPLRSFACTANKPQTLRMESGTSISIPENAFVDKDGQPVQGEVQIQFREFHNAAEIMASGIPMKVMGEGGEEGWMQTAGMYEIKGFQGGEPVFIAEGKTLAVNLASQVGGSYDFWKFEPEKGNWDNFGPTEAMPNPAAQDAARQMAELERQTPAPPVQPIAFDKSKPALDFDLDYERFPELKNKRGITWQYAGNNPKEDPATNDWIFTESWEKVQLEPLANATTGQYRLTLEADNGKRYQIPVRPTLNEKELASAKVDYEQQMAFYRTKLAAIQAQKQAFAAEQAAFTRSFQVQGFGIYNYDILLKNQESVRLLADFDFGPGVPESLKKQVKVFLITGGMKAVVSLPYQDWGKLSFDPNAENRLVAVLPGNRIATFSNSDFQEQKADLQAAKGQRFVFKMKVDERKAESVADVQKRLLGLG